MNSDSNKSSEEENAPTPVESDQSKHNQLLLPNTSAAIGLEQARQFVAKSTLYSSWLLRSDIGEVIKTIVDDGAFTDYAIPKKTTERNKPGR
jgi:hypothetical protein